MKNFAYGLAVLVVVLACGPAWAQNTTEEKSATPADQWSDFLHYIRIARPELAVTYGQALLDAGVPAKDIYILSMKRPDTGRTLRKGAQLEGLAKMTKQFQTLIEEGYSAWRSDPEQIESAIQMMSGTARGYAIGKQRLVESGEYAIPMLLEKLTADKTPDMIRERIITVLPAMGKYAVRPLSCALQSSDLGLVETLATVLGEIQYPHALPRLREVLTRKEVKPDSKTAKIVQAAMMRCSGGNPKLLQASAAELFYLWGTKYYNRAESLLPDVRLTKEAAMAWFWKETYLEARPIPREILVDVYAMRFARLSLKHDATYAAAVPLWMSACIRRKLDLPEGATDGLWPASAPQPAFFTLATSPKYLQMTLYDAMEDGNADIARVVIGAMGMNMGAPAMVSPLADGSQPLVSALQYPDRAVRFMAAETLALAQPTKNFDSSAAVMYQLSEALRQEGQRYALLVVKEEAARNNAKAILRDAGFGIIEVGPTDRLVTKATQALAIDVVFVGPKTHPGKAVQELRAMTRFKHIPIVLNRTSLDLKRMASADGKIVLMDQKISEDGKVMIEKVEAATKLAIGKPLTEEQALDWSIRASRAIQAVGTRGSDVYKLTDTVKALTIAMGAKSTDLQIAAARAASTIKSAPAQQAVIALAINAETDEAVRIAAFKAASRSVRQYGSDATNEQANAVIEVVLAKGTHELRQAAAQLLGSMNLASEKTPQLILSTDAID